MKKRVLFVDDERSVLEGLRRMLRNMRQEWEMVFAESGREALNILRDESFDVVVSDMRMPGMDGCQLLTKVKEHYPELVRIIQSGYADTEMILKSVRVAHQYLAKPCDCETLKSNVARALALRELLSNEMLIRVVSSLETLPSVPSLYQEVMQGPSTPNASIEKVGKIIARDVSMTAKILQPANSAFFSRFQSVSSLERALALLGLDTIVALVLSVQIFSTPKQASGSHLSIPALWDHIVEAIACHHRPNRGLAHRFSPMTTVHVGNALAYSNHSDGPKQVADRPTAELGQSGKPGT